MCHLIQFGKGSLKPPANQIVNFSSWQHLITAIAPIVITTTVDLLQKAI